MNLYKTFAAFPPGVSPERMLECWEERMDSLLFSDKNELLQFISDGCLALMAQMREEDRSVDDILGLLRQVLEPDWEMASASVVGRRNQIRAVVGEMVEGDPGEAVQSMAGFMREAPWPEWA